MRPLGPEQLLLRVGLLGDAGHRASIRGRGVRRDRPWFFQWLVRWRVTGLVPRRAARRRRWRCRARARCGPTCCRSTSRCPASTWSEQESGPLTDRLFATQLEFRWRRAPWPWLPSAAGRAWWEYAGTDFLPRGPGGLIPEISAPASVAGCELVGPRWDLAVEYAETLHPLVLWYSNGSFPSGYTNDGWLLGHRWAAPASASRRLVRWCARAAAGGAWYAEFGLSRTTWGDEGHTPGAARTNGPSR